jgi:hypothetical protein
VRICALTGIFEETMIMGIMQDNAMATSNYPKRFEDENRRKQRKQTIYNWLMFAVALSGLSLGIFSAFHDCDNNKFLKKQQEVNRELRLQIKLLSDSLKSYSHTSHFQEP